MENQAFSRLVLQFPHKKREMLSEFDRPWQHFPAARQLLLPYRSEKDGCCGHRLYHRPRNEKTGSCKSRGKSKEVKVNLFKSS
jgi:hypothetical protein